MAYIREHNGMQHIQEVDFRYFDFLIKTLAKKAT